MNDEQCRMIYQQLVEILRRQEMNWVVQLVAEEISTGIIVKPNDDNLTIREFTPQEKLKILVNYIKQSVVDGVLTEYEIVSFFYSNEYFEDLSPRIGFASNIDIEDENYFYLRRDTNQNLYSQVEEAHSLNNLLMRILQDIDNA
jgi:hypothetical protein